MKIRTGFVSNSSSSSFICKVCGETQSGMDMSLSDAEMMECENGHTFCQLHQLAADVSLEDKRKKLVDNVHASPYYNTNPKQKEAQLASIAERSEDDVNEAYEDAISNDGHSAQECPICMFKNVDQGLSFRYLLRKIGMTEATLLVELKTNFATFSDFKKTIIEK